MSEPLFCITAKPSARRGQRASTNGPDLTAKFIHTAIGDSSSTLQVGLHSLPSEAAAAGLVVSPSVAVRPGSRGQPIGAAAAGLVVSPSVAVRPAERSSSSRSGSPLTHAITPARSLLLKRARTRAGTLARTRSHTHTSMHAHERTHARTHACMHARTMLVHNCT